MGPRQMLCVDVRFKSRKQLADLIRGLSGILNGDMGYNHVHVHDRRLKSKDRAATEVTFYAPKTKRDSAVMLCVEEARKTLSGANAS